MKHHPAQSAGARSLAWIEAKTPWRGGDLPGLARRGRGGRLRGADRGSTFHHVMSRLTDDVPFLDAVEKTGLERLMRKLCRFCGLEILTYCVMGNHFHVLLRVPDRAEWLRRFSGEAGEAALFEHLGVLYTKGYVARIREEVQALRGRGRARDAEAVLNSFRRRFCDVSVWGQEMKGRFARWLNLRRGRKGAVWMGRFKDVLVQDGIALRTMACYIDLNPVRAGMVDDAADYRWCTYGRACGGAAWARDALAEISKWGGGGGGVWGEVQGDYRAWLSEAGAWGGTGESRKEPESAVEGPTRVGSGPALGAGKPLHGRVRPFSGGLAVGHREWVEGWFESNRSKFGARRRQGARPMRSLAGELHALRDLSCGVGRGLERPASSA